MIWCVFAWKIFLFLLGLSIERKVWRISLSSRVNYGGAEIDPRDKGAAVYYGSPVTCVRNKCDRGFGHHH